MPFRWIGCHTRINVYRYRMSIVRMWFERNFQCGISMVNKSMDFFILRGSSMCTIVVLSSKEWNASAWIMVSSSFFPLMKLNCRCRHHHRRRRRRRDSVIVFIWNALCVWYCSISFIAFALAFFLYKHTIKMDERVTGCYVSTEMSLWLMYDDCDSI